MATNERTRARYGICLSDSCPKCKDKTIQIITGRKDFVCEECGKPLREVPRPRTAWEKHGKKIIGGLVAVAVIGGAGTFFALGGGKKAPEKSSATQVNLPKGQGVDSVKTTPEPVNNPQEPVNNPQEPVKPATEPVNPDPEPVKKTPQPVNPGPKQVQNGTGTVNLGYGVYKGDIKNGKPHGHGTITYKSSHKIVASKDFVANPGDTFEGDFRDGMVSGGIGYWKHDGDITAVKP